MKLFQKSPLPSARRALGVPPKAAPDGFLTYMFKDQPLGRGISKIFEKSAPGEVHFFKQASGAPFLKWPWGNDF